MSKQWNFGLDREPKIVSPREEFRKLVIRIGAEISMWKENVEIHRSSFLTDKSIPMFSLLTIVDTCYIGFLDEDIRESEVLFAGFLLDQREKKLLAKMLESPYFDLDLRISTEPQIIQYAEEKLGEDDWRPIHDMWSDELWELR